MNHLNKKIDFKSIKIEGVDMRDYPDFVDAFISYARYEDGSLLDEDDLNLLAQDHEVIYRTVLNGMH